MTNQQKFIEAYGVDTWRQIIASSGNAEQFKEFWTSPYCRNEKKWIPCTPETMPEEDGYYWVTDINGHVVTYVYDSSGNSEEYWQRCAKAWMPYVRPEPYKPEEE